VEPLGLTRNSSHRSPQSSRREPTQHCHVHSCGRARTLDHPHGSLRRAARSHVTCSENGACDVRQFRKCAHGE
jgi:hypothetical protein